MNPTIKELQIFKKILPSSVKHLIYKLLYSPLFKAIWLDYLSHKIINEYINSNNTNMLNIGCGKNELPGWLNTDLEPMTGNVAYIDASKTLPFQNNTFDYVYTEHLIEHLPYEDGLKLLTEIFRILKPKGKLRIVTPDLRIFISLFDENKSKEQIKFINWVSENFLQKRGINSNNEAFVLDQYIRFWDHKFLYDNKTLFDSLACIGFKDFKECDVGDSDYPELKGIEGHGVVIGNLDMNVFESLVVEAEKSV